MKNIIYIVLLATLGCKNQTNQSEETIPEANTEETSSASKKYYTTKDTLLIVSENGDTLKYGKDEFNAIVDNHPELYSEYTQEPNQLYYCNANSGDFGSEVGQDSYYGLYAYFLKQKNGIDNNSAVRKKLIGIYQNINSLFQRFQYGGTYFGHQHSRILGYAEYSVYLYSQSRNHIEKTYDITKQKELYIKSLRQLIADESKIDYNTLGKEKTERNKELNKTVDELNELITDNFYLRRAQEFHYRHYEYY
ncbi:hypothetical protein [Flavobacterium pedocola]